MFSEHCYFLEKLEKVRDLLTMSQMNEYIACITNLTLDRPSTINENFGKFLLGGNSFYMR